MDDRMSRFGVLTLVGGLIMACCAAAELSLRPLTGEPLRRWCLSEFEVAGEVPREGLNPFDPDSVAVDAVFAGPSGQGIRLPAFWHQDYERRMEAVQVTANDGSTQTREGEVLTPRGQPGWRVRFTPVEAGRHRVRVEVLCAGRTVTGPAAALDVQPAPADARGFVRVNPDARRYFMTDDGQPLVLLGECCCWHGARGTFDYDNWLADYPPNGMNYTRLWMWPQAFGIEVLEGERLNYNLAKAWTLDYVLALASQRGVRVMLCLDYHGIFQVDPDMWGGNNRWPRHPYNASTGGPCGTQNDFFTNPAAAGLYRKRLRYLVGRYGAYPSLLSWQFFNEINNVYRYLKPEDVVAWHDGMARWLHDRDPYRHLVTTSFGSVGEQAAMWQLESLDYCQWHLYLNWAGKCRHPAAACAEVGERFLRDYGKPVYLGEYGTDGRGWRSDADPHRRGLQQAVWGGVMGGTAGTAMPWWWEGMHAAKVHALWKSLAGFIDGTGLGSKGWEPLRLPLPGEAASVLAQALSNGRDALLWVIDPRFNYPEGVGEAEAPVVSGAQVVLPGLPDGRYVVTWWDPWQGAPCGQAAVTSRQGALWLPLPDFRVDLAARVVRAD